MIYYIVLLKGGSPVDVISYGADKEYRDQCYHRYFNKVASYFDSVYRLDVTP